MPWFKVDDGLSSKLETTRIPRAHRAATIGLWTLAGSWSARELTDGHIPSHMIDELAGTPDDAQRLVDAGYWLAVDDGFQFAVWDGEQPMRAKVIEGRERNAAKVQAWRTRNRVTPAVTNDSTNPGVTPPPTRPDPTDEKNSPSPAATELDEAFDRVWALWPKKTEKKRSRTAFTRAASKRGLGAVVADIERFGRQYAATTEKRFIPALCVWLTGERWDDELPTPQPVSDDDWSAFLASSDLPRSCERGGEHRWLADGTCNFCPERQPMEIGAA